MNYLGYNSRPKVKPHKISIKLNDNLTIDTTTDRLVLHGDGFNFQAAQNQLEGLPVLDNIVLKGYNFKTIDEAQLRLDEIRFGQSHDNLIVNNLTDLANGYQLLSVHNWSTLDNSFFRSDKSIIEFYDLIGSITTLENYCFHNSDNLEVLSTPSLTSVQPVPFVGDKANFRLWECPKLLNWPDNFYWQYFPVGFNLKVNRKLENWNGLGFHPEIQRAMDERNANVEFV